MSPNVLLCKQCGKLFQSLGSSFCPACVDEMDKAFVVVKEYLYEHDNATLMDIVKDTGISEKMVLSFLKEGRLNIEGVDDFLKCEDCGKPISSGRYCSVCRDRLANAFGSMVKEKRNPGVKVQAKMHARYGQD